MFTGHTKDKDERMFDVASIQFIIYYPNLNDVAQLGRCNGLLRFYTKFIKRLGLLEVSFCPLINLAK